MSKRLRLGFTLVELMITLMIIGVLASIAVPKYRDIRRRATATQILGDYDVLRHAVLSFYVDSQYFPAEAGSGATPANLQKYLPTSFKMTKPQWTLDYENWGVKSKMVSTDVVIGISFSTPADTILGRTAMRLFGNTPRYTTGTKYTLLLSGF